MPDGKIYIGMESTNGTANYFNTLKSLIHNFVQICVNKFEIAQIMRFQP